VIFGTEDFTPLVLDEKTKKLARMEVPPSTGYGAEDDTLANWDRINPVRPPDKSAMILHSDKYVKTFD